MLIVNRNLLLTSQPFFPQNVSELFEVDQPITGELDLFGVRKTRQLQLTGVRKTSKL